MTVNFKEILNIIAEGTALTRQQSRDTFEYIMSGNASEAQIAACLMGLRVRGETVDEITGAVEVIRSKAISIKAPANAVDPVGTGGDAHGTYNISTAAAIVLAACDVPVAKHGGRAVSSKSGSADVLESLGINLELEKSIVEQGLEDLNIGFFLATRHHNAMRFVAPIRAAMGIRTIFNLLGPLTNPAGTKHSLIGVFDKKWLRPIAEVMAELGAKHVWVVHGSDGLDELTTTGPSYVVEYKDGQYSEFVVTPEDYGLSRVSLDDLKGGDAAHNAAAMRDLFSGTPSAYRDIVVLNTAAALVVAGKVQNLGDGVSMAKAAIDQGAAKDKLEKWAAFTQAHAKASL